MEIKYLFGKLVESLTVPIINKISSNRLPELKGASPLSEHYLLAADILENAKLSIKDDNYDKLKEIVAYFIKYGQSSYRYTNELLSSLNIISNNSIVDQNQIRKIAIDKLSKILATAPWMGDEDDAYSKCICTLLDKRILKLEIKEQSNKDIDVIFEVDFSNGYLSKKDIDSVTSEWTRAERSRNDYELKNEAKQFEDMLEFINKLDSKDKITLKIATFHLRTKIKDEKYAMELLKKKH